MSLLLPRVSIINYWLSLDFISRSNLVLILYDTILTLPREIELIWGRRFRVAVLLYTMTRYCIVSSRLLMLVIVITAKVFVVHPRFHV